MTRDLNWGIPVPVEGAEGKVLYVWFDAPIGYVSNTVELCKNQPEKWGNWEKWWQDEDTRLVHFIGKDNIVFHCIIFPVMMKAHGKYIMPDNVPSNEFLNLENDKISTSRNWAVWLHEYLVDMPGKQDVLRYVLTANAPETKDNNFTWKDFQDRNNNELVAVYGNFVNRALQLTKKYWNGVVPACDELLDVDKQALEEFKDVKAKVESLLDQYRQPLHHRVRTLEGMEDRPEALRDHSEHLSAAHRQPGHRLRAVPALLQQEAARHAEPGELRVGRAGQHRPAEGWSPAG